MRVRSTRRTRGSDIDMAGVVMLRGFTMTENLDALTFDIRACILAYGEESAATIGDNTAVEHVQRVGNATNDR
jgi:hypothetical protein